MKFFLVILLAVCAVSCKHKKERIEKDYYDTGELRTIWNYQNDSICYLKLFYKNGHLEREGTVKNDSIVEGHHRFYYSDGTLLWEGEYINSVPQSEYKKDWTWEGVAECLQDIEIEGSPKRLKIGQSYKFRITMPKIHPTFYMVTDEDFFCLQNIEGDEDLYPWVYTPTEKGRFILRVLFTNQDGYGIVGNPMITFSPEVEVE